MEAPRFEIWIWICLIRLRGSNRIEVVYLVEIILLIVGRFKSFQWNYRLLDVYCPNRTKVGIRVRICSVCGNFNNTPKNGQKAPLVPFVLAINKTDDPWKLFPVKNDHHSFVCVLELSRSCCFCSSKTKKGWYFSDPKFFKSSRKPDSYDLQSFWILLEICKINYNITLVYK